MATDISLPSKDQVLVLLNKSNGTRLTFNNIEFGTPRPYVGSASNRNTELEVISLATGGYQETVTVRYKRINLSDFSLIKPPTFVMPDEGTVESVLKAFNELYGAALDSSDILGGLTVPTVPDGTTEPATFVLKASPTSYAYRGEIHITLLPEELDLADIILTVDLDGLNLN